MSTGVVESTVHQVISQRFCEKPPMAWAPRGAHRLLPIRTRVLKGQWETTCREWSPGFRVAPPLVAACPPGLNALPRRIEVGNNAVKT
jgi:hypothetical protein